MKWNVGHTKRPQDKWAGNRKSGYEWEEEGVDDFSYDSMNDPADYVAEPDYIEFDSGQTGYRGGHAQHEIYAQDGDYAADQEYEAGMEYASEPDYELNHDYVDGDQPLPETYDQETYEGYDQGGYEPAYYDEAGYDESSYDENYDQENYGDFETSQGAYGQEVYDETGADQEIYDQEAYDQENYDEPEYDEMTYDDSEFKAYGRSGGRRAAAAAATSYVGGETRTVAYSREEREAVRRASSHATSGTGSRNGQTRNRRDDGFQGEITYIDDYDQKPRAARASSASRSNKGKKDDGGGFSPLDGLLAVVGIIIILGLAGFIGWFYMSHKDPEDPHSQFAGIGKQLQSIELIGGKGITAVAKAEMAKLTQEIDDTEDPYDEPDPSGQYDENPYANTIAVAMSLTSVQKDLKIKFSNRETAKLVGNVRFVAQITKPDGTVEEWVDSDMDGIIYEKGIDSGKYSVTIKALTDEKYNNLILPSTSQTVTVKKNIDYTKVDVSGEGKKESEINVNQEDTKKNETDLEGSLTDTVTWVASSTTGNTYTEVLKSTIPDPLTRPISVAMNFLRTAQTTDPDSGNTDPNAGNTDPGTTTPEKFKISFNANGGEGNMAEVEVEAGSYTLPGCGFTAPANKEFDKWDKGAVGESITVEGNVTLTALWKDKAVTTYTVSFAANGGGGSMNSVTVEAGKNYTLPECAFTAPENKEFDKWDQGAVGASITVNGNVTLTAQWKDKTATQIKVTFAAGEGGSGSMNEVTAPAGSYTLPECKFTAPEGKKFDKWDKGKVGEKIDLTGNVTLTALWKTATAATSLELDLAKVELKMRKAADGTSTSENGTVKATAKGFAEGKELKYEATSADNAIATAAIDATGKITVIAVGKGTTKVTVSVDYKNDADKDANVTSKVTKTVEVVVTEKEALSVTVDKAELLCYSEVNEPALVLEVTIKNSEFKAADLIESKMKFTAECSDTAVAVISKKEFLPTTTDGTVKIKLTMTAQVLTEKKSCVLTAKYEEGTETATAKSTLTVKPHPRYDKTTPLVDKDGKQLYVEASGSYRQAVYADYYVEGTKFFVQSGVKYTGWQTLDGKVYFFNAEGKYVTGEQVIQGAKYTFGSDGALMTGNAILGIDVSRWNGSIDWKAVKNSGVSFVIIRCGYRGSTQGTLIEDSKFTTNIKGATNAGLKVGIYFFTQAVDEVEAVYEASYVIDKIKNYKITYPVFLDVEASGGRADKISKETRTKVCKAFCQTIQNAGYTAGIYANKTWLTEKMDASQLSAYKIWLAQYAAAPTYTGKYDLWQYKSTGTVGGISGNVDMNLSYMGY